MTLQEACRILAEFHTRDDSLTKYVVETVVGDFYHTPYTHAEYIEAWGVVRDFGQTGQSPQ